MIVKLVLSWCVNKLRTSSQRDVSQLTARELHFQSVHEQMGSSEQRGNYRGLIEQVIKVMKHLVKGLIRQRDEIDEMQCDFTLGRWH